MDDLDRLVREFAPVVREFVTDANTALVDRIKALEDGSVVTELRAEVLALKGELETIRNKPEPDIAAIVKTVVDEAMAAIPAPTNGEDGKDGQSVTVDDLRPMVAEELAKAVSELPAPTNGADGKDGESVAPADVEAMVAKAVEAIPTPKDGSSVTLDDVTPLISAEVAKVMDTIPVAKDGVGVVSALIDRDGHLIVTLSDGATKDVGVVVGKDADFNDMHRMVVSELEKWPRPKDGRDGFGFDDLSVEKTGKRTVTFTFTKGDRVQSFPIKFDGMTFWEGRFEEGKSYEAGDQVQFGGHQWTAKEDTDGTVKPDEHTVDGRRIWVMSVRRGKEGKAGPQGLPGPKGKDGIDWGLRK